MQSFYEQGYVSWALWASCLAVGLGCLIPSKNSNIGMRWASPKIAFGFAFLMIHVIRPFYLMLIEDYYGARLGYYSFSNSLEMNLMLLASALGGSAFLLGWKWGMLRWKWLNLGINRRRSTQSTNILFKRILILVPFAAFALIWGVWGNVAQDLINLYYFLRCSLIVITYLSVVAAIYSKNRTRRKLFFIMATISSLAFLWLFLREGGASRLFLLMFIIPGFVVLSFIFKRKAFVMIILSTIIFIFIFMFLGNVRSSLHEGASIAEQLDDQTSDVMGNLFSYFLQGGDFDAFEKGMLVIEIIPSDESPYLGRTFATLITMPIPRILWPDKPESSITDVIVKRYPLIPENFAITFIGEAYGNFLWPGVIVVLLLFGLISAKVYRHNMSPQPNTESCILLGFYMAYVILVVRGSFHTMTSYYLFCLFWIMSSNWVFKPKWIKQPEFSFSRSAADLKTERKQSQKHKKIIKLN